MAENLKIAAPVASSSEVGALAPVVEMPSAQKPKPESDFPFSVMVSDVYEGPLDLLLDVTRVQQVQRLRRRQAIIAFRFETRVARRPSELLQKRTRDAAVWQAGLRRTIRLAILNAADDHAIQQHRSFFDRHT